MISGGIAGERSGPLRGIRVVEFASIGPGPMCAMLLSDMGAEVLRLERHGGTGNPNPVLTRGRIGLPLDFKDPADLATCLAAADRADVVIEGFRPGVMERLGLGPDVLMKRNPQLVYGRMTGWGQDGPLAQTAGHDINFIAITGALAAMGGPGGAPPEPPLNLVGDFGGGSLYLALGIIAALFERTRSGEGQVVDAAIVDGVASLMAMVCGLAGNGINSLDRDRNLLGGAAPYYRSYRCADGRDIAVGPIEPQFHRELLQRMGAPAELLEGRQDPEGWTDGRADLADLFAQRPSGEWRALLEESDACFAPVLTLAEAVDHSHLAQRGTYERRDGVIHPAPAPRFSRTPAKIATAQDGRAILDRWLES